MYLYDTAGNKFPFGSVRRLALAATVRVPEAALRAFLTALGDAELDDVAGLALPVDDRAMQTIRRLASHRKCVRT